MNTWKTMNRYLRQYRSIVCRGIVWHKVFWRLIFHCHYRPVFLNSAFTGIIGLPTIGRELRHGNPDHQPHGPAVFIQHVIQDGSSQRNISPTSSSNVFINQAHTGAGSDYVSVTFLLSTFIINRENYSWNRPTINKKVKQHFKTFLSLFLNVQFAPASNKVELVVSRSFLPPSLFCDYQTKAIRNHYQRFFFVHTANLIRIYENSDLLHYKTSPLIGDWVLAQTNFLKHVY